MKSLSRRSFLRKGTLAVGAVGAAATVPSLGRLRSGHDAAAAGRLPLAGTSAPAAAGRADVPADGAIVAHVRDVRRGEIDVFVGTRKVTLRDPETAARLSRATR